MRPTKSNAQESLGGAPLYLQLMSREALIEAARRKRVDSDHDRYEQYQNNPVGFCCDVLGENFTDDTKELMQSVVDSQVTVAKSGNSVGKTHAAARLAIWFYKVFPDSQVYTTTAPPFDNLKRLLWGEIRTVFKRHMDTVFSTDMTKSMHIYRSPQSFITGVAIPMSGTSEEREAKFSGKHAPYLFFIVDEGDAVPDEVYKGIESCMSGGHARLLVTFNPKAQSGPVYIRERDGTAKIVKLSALAHPNVVTGKNIFPGAVTRETTVRRVNEWTRPLLSEEYPDESCFEVPEFLINETSRAMDGRHYPPLNAGHRKIIEPSFSYMVLGEYPAQSSHQLISSAWVEAARRRHEDYVKEHGERIVSQVSPKLGLDIAEFGTDHSVICRRYDNFVAKILWRQWNDPDQITNWALQVYEESMAEIIYVDGTGVGAGVAPMIARRGRSIEARAVGVKVSSKPSPIIKSEIGEFYQLRDQLWWAVREWLRAEEAMLPNDPYLLEELLIPTYEVRQDTGKIKIMDKGKMKSKLKRSPDRADALCLTFTPIKRAKVVRLMG